MGSPLTKRHAIYHIPTSPDIKTEAKTEDKSEVNTEETYAEVPTVHEADQVEVRAKEEAEATAPDPAADGPVEGKRKRRYKTKPPSGAQKKKRKKMKRMLELQAQQATATTAQIACLKCLSDANNRSAQNQPDQDLNPPVTSS